MSDPRPEEVQEALAYDWRSRANCSHRDFEGVTCANCAQAEVDKLKRLLDTLARRCAALQEEVMRLEGDLDNYMLRAGKAEEEIATLRAAAQRVVDTYDAVIVATTPLFTAIDELAALVAAPAPQKENSNG